MSIWKLNEDIRIISELDRLRTLTNESIYLLMLILTTCALPLRTSYARRWWRRWRGTLTDRRLATRSVTLWSGLKTSSKTSTTNGKFYRTPWPPSSRNSGRRFSCLYSRSRTVYIIITFKLYDLIHWLFVMQLPVFSSQTESEMCAWKCPRPGLSGQSIPLPCITQDIFRWRLQLLLRRDGYVVLESLSNP